MLKPKIEAFTMAEVLVTLGIIGIVAATTLPALTKKYKHKVLEAQFKKSVSIISQVILSTKQELSADKLAEFCTTYDETNNKYMYQKECADTFFKNFRYSSTKRNLFTGGILNIQRYDEKILTYNGRHVVTTDNLQAIGGPIFETALMPDGSFLNLAIIEHRFYIGVDTNGQRGPNQLGHDIFIFTIDKNNDTLSFSSKPQNYSDEELDKGDYEHEYQKARKGNPCNSFSNQKANGIGCAWYALRDECPDESGLSYFECLP